MERRQASANLEPPTPKAVVSWSSGKDAAFALHEVRRRGDVEVVGLLTTVTEPFGRVSMHGVRTSVLEAQAAAVGLPLLQVPIPYPCPNVVYELRISQALDRVKSEGVTLLVFGDLFLEDVRRYREEQLAPTEIRPIFPLWHRSTDALAHEMIAAGLEAVVVCVDPRRIGRRFAGRRFDEQLLSELPNSVDPCGENGEFHTCVVNGPMFRMPVPIQVGPTVDRDGFAFTDVELRS